MYLARGEEDSVRESLLPKNKVLQAHGTGTVVTDQKYSPAEEKKFQGCTYVCVEDKEERSNY